jgi:hypothetical protein
MSDFKNIQTQKKRPLGVSVISVSVITYGVLDIVQLFMPIRTETTIEYSFPILGILFIINGIGIFASIEWARKGMIIACCLAIIMSVQTITQPFPLNVVSLLSIIIFGLIVFYLMRTTIKNYFIEHESASKKLLYQKLKELISQDIVLLLPHKKFRGVRQLYVYARCGLSLKYFERAYNNGDVILQFGERGPRVGFPLSWENALTDYLTGSY